MLPHAGQPVMHAGAPLERARAAMIMVHGRGAAPANILDLFPLLEQPGLAAVAPAAAGNSWYPFNFMTPREQNEPGISSALGVLESLVVELQARGVPAHRIILLGFSQGACLSSEFVIRHPRRYGGLMALSGGLIGAAGTTWEDVTADLGGTPVFLGCSDVDPHIPAARVRETEAVFRRLGAAVTCRLYPGMGHAVSNDQIEVVRTAVRSALSAE
jgi:phospholipase/carboxylesterase